MCLAIQEVGAVGNAKIVCGLEVLVHHLLQDDGDGLQALDHACVPELLVTQKFLVLLRILSF